ncbi:DUF7079 family protein [Hymenobacter cellulosivorans]|uniref:DUF7079 domain-containing protein n=1 Tax=Hymenobacter cellulosivorans TaxID=2932249 RepID=A0ABY4FDH6_9BACT|nr:hypothetical protein [Hymenobacter cellulosivorans]UOQ54728.1 hypothetical protein MUN80_08210 [Hymenobacter cellulosivorans]
MASLSSSEIQRRKPVWIALSEFYLDTELERNDIARIRSVIVESGYSKQQVLAMNYNEVAPIVIANTLGVAGVWSEFDQQWLVESILERLNRKFLKMSIPGLQWLFRRYIDLFSKKYLRQIFVES